MNFIFLKNSINLLCLDEIKIQMKSQSFFFSKKNKFITDAKSFRKVKFFKIDNDFLFHKISRPKMSWKKTYFRESDKRDFEFP